MARKYKIFHNHTVFLLLKESDLAEINQSYFLTEIIDESSILSFPDLFESTWSDSESYIAIICKKPKHTLKQVYKQTEKVIAAGGIVKNAIGSFLFIYRKGFWDLPKGKLEKGEKINLCAKREVIEETGLKTVEIIEKFKYPNFKQSYTLHTYNRKNKWKTKPSYWYYMETEGCPELQPQIEEDIERAIWLSLEEIEEIQLQAYPAIQDIINVLLDSEL